MLARGLTKFPCAFMILLILAATAADAGPPDKKYRYPLKVKTSGTDSPDYAAGGIRSAYGAAAGDWAVAAGQPRGEILCPRRGFAFALGVRPYFTGLLGSIKATNRGGEGTYMSFGGHLRLESDKTQWELYSQFRLWDRIALRVEYLPWQWTGQGHVPSDGNFAGLLLKSDEAITSDLNITSVLVGADYDVSFGRDLVFGPNADLYVIKWTQRVARLTGATADFSQTILQPAIGVHVRYEPSFTGYFSWFKPALESRFSWMSFVGLGLSTWDLAAGIAPPVSRNVDAGIKIGYKQWKLDGSRGRLYTDMAVEGPYLDFSLQF
jgi:hypothetical protein